MVLSIDHIELIVRDVDEFVEFYQKLGFKLLSRTGHHGDSAELQLPGDDQPIIELHVASGEENIGVNHIALKVSNAHEAHTELAAKGITFYAEGPRFIQSTGRTVVNFRDPDGWRLQLVDAERKEATGIEAPR